MRNLILPALLAATVCLPGKAAEQRALLIGINDYPRASDQLFGCLNDVERVETVLREQFGFSPDSIRILRNGEATTAGIVEAFKEHLIRPGRPDDVVVFYYSGHGTSTVDQDGDEEDGYDEALYTYDTDALDDRTWMTDDVVFQLLQRLPAERALVVFDCCHSGTGNRGIAEEEPAAADSPRARYVELGFRMPGEAEYRSAGNTRSVSVRTARDRPGHLFFAACQPYEKAYETEVQGKRYGIMTHALTSYLEQKPDVQLEELSQWLRKNVEEWSLNQPGVDRQQPVIEGVWRRDANFKDLLAGRIESGQAEESDAPPDGVPSQPLPSVEDILPGYQPSGEIAVSLALNQEEFAVGDKLSVRLKLSEDAHVRLYYYSADRTVHQIFPNKYQQEDFVRAGQTAIIPGANAPFSFTMNEPFGLEVLKAVASDRPFTDLEAEEVAAQLFLQFEDADLRDASLRGIDVEAVEHRHGEAIIFYRVKEP